MSRLNDAIGKIETALAELTSSLEQLTQQQSAPAADTSAPAIDVPAIDVNELEAMKAELGEAVRLLESVQTATQSSDEASS